MGSYTGNIGKPDRTKALLAVIAVHAALAFIIVSGLNVHAIRRAVEQMTTINVAEPPPPQPPPPAEQAERAKKAEGAAAKRAEPTEVVAPPAKLPPTNPLPAAPVAGTGSASSSGAALSGTGTGAGGSGNGPGGGGTGDTSKFTPARLTRNLSRGDYAALASGRIPVGSADVSIAIAPNGTLSDCRILRSSGDSTIDRNLCPVLVQRLRFRPALDDRGRPISYRTNYHASWRLGY